MIFDPFLLVGLCNILVEPVCTSLLSVYMVPLSCKCEEKLHVCVLMLEWFQSRTQ